MFDRKLQEIIPIIVTWYTSLAFLFSIIWFYILIRFVDLHRFKINLVYGTVDAHETFCFSLFRPKINANQRDLSANRNLRFV